MWLAASNVLLLIGGPWWSRIRLRRTGSPTCRLRRPFSQLSYGPYSRCERLEATALYVACCPQRLVADWWAMVESNHRPRSYQDRALTS
jgi:hypothetical protein